MSEEREIDAELKALLDDIELFEEGNKFLKSKVGMFLLDRAIAEEDAARTEWIGVDPYDHKEIARLQLKARIPNLIFSWLKEAIVMGNQAKTFLDQELENGR